MHSFSSFNYSVSILLRASAGQAESWRRKPLGLHWHYLVPDSVYLVVIIVNEEAPKHSFAYFAPNYGNKLLQFDVAGFCRVPLGIFAVLGRLPWNSEAICLVSKAYVGLPIHPSLAPWQTSSLSADNLMWKVTFGASGSGIRQWDSVETLGLWYQSPFSHCNKWCYLLRWLVFCQLNTS